MKKVTRAFSLMLAVFVAFGMICFGTGEASAASSWEMIVGDIQYAGNPIPNSVEVTDWENNEFATVTSAKSSNSKVVKITKEKWDGETHYSMYFKKVGKAKITVKYKTPAGKTGKITKTVKVLKYPDPIKSIKVNGKAIKVSDNKFMYNLEKYKKTSAKIKITPASGWKITNVSATASNWSNGKTKTIKVSKSTFTKGKSFSVPKGYDCVDINISLEKGDKYFDYYIGILRQ